MAKIVDIIDKYTTQPPSFCHVFSNIWIGDFNTARHIAMNAGMVDNTSFGAVFNAAGTEIYEGYTMEPIYKTHGIFYDTLLDRNTGMTLGDGDIHVPENELASRMAMLADTEPSITTKVDDKIIQVHKAHYMYDYMFLHLMIQAAIRIRMLSDLANGKKILVHCMAGRNRSAAAIVAYLVFVEKVPNKLAISIVQEAVLNARKMRCLTNQSFIAYLKIMSIKTHYHKHKNILHQHLEKYNRIVTKAKALLPVGCSRQMTENILPHVLSILSVIMLHECAFCGSAPTDLKRCSACKRVYYCNTECQRKDYQRHQHQDHCE